MLIGRVLTVPVQGAAWIVCLSLGPVFTTAADAADFLATQIPSSQAYISANGLTAVAGSNGTLVVWTSSGTTSVPLVTPLGMSADGSTVLGYSPYAGTSAGVRVQNGVAYYLDPDQDEFDTKPTGVSSDGSVIVGTKFGLSGSDYVSYAYRWSATGGFVILPSFYGMGIAKGVSADGTIVVGGGLAGPDDYETAVRWVVDAQGHATGYMLGSGPGNPPDSEALGISADGTAIIGTEGSPHTHAFRWTDATGMQDITPNINASYNAVPNGISKDGSVVIGNVNGNTAFRWSTQYDLEYLGNLAAYPGTDTFASAMSADGTVVVGKSDDGHDRDKHAFLWTEATKMVSLNDLLTNAGVNLGSDVMQTADDISANGKIVVGEATHTSGGTRYLYIANLDGVDLSGGGGGGGTPGVVSADVIDASFQSLGDPGANNNGHLGQVFGTPGQFGPPRGDGPSAFASGSFDSDPAASGSVGLTTPLGGGFALGVVVDAGKLTDDLTYGGHSDFTSGSAVAFLARNSNSGLQLFLGSGGDLFGGSITRGYLNGVTPVSSVGATSGYGFGGKGQVGFRVGDASDGVSLMPFVSGTYAITHIRGYTETGGPFPATVNPIDTSATQWRGGVEARVATSNGFALSASLTGVHSTATSGGISGTVAGFLNVDQPVGTAISDWLETGAGLTVPMGTSADANLSVIARFPVHGVRSYAGQAGMRFAF